LIPYLHENEIKTRSYVITMIGLYMTVDDTFRIESYINLDFSHLSQRMICICEGNI